MPNEGNPEIRLSINEVVRWESQASGVWKSKQGHVIAIVPKGQSPKDIFYGLPEHEKFSYRYKGAKNRSHDSYLVAVFPEKGKAKPKVYWPLNRNLRLLSEIEASESRPEEATSISSESSENSSSSATSSSSFEDRETQQRI